VSGPAAVAALVLAESAAGTAGFLFLTPLWGEVRRGFFYLTGVVVLALSGSAAAAAAAAGPGTAQAELAVALSLGLVGATVLWLVLLLLGAPGAARALGVGSVGLGVATLWALARAAEASVPLPFLQLLAGAGFTGAVLAGLLLGHWYLTDRKLGRSPITRMAWALLAAVALEAAGVAVGFGGGPAPRPGSGLNPLLTVAGSASWIALGMVLITGLIAALIRLTLRSPRPTAVQSATGFFYLAVITGFTAELAAKVRFLS
jgi:hypothetical protein